MSTYPHWRDCWAGTFRLTPAPAICLRRRSLQRSSCGPRGACRPRLPERLFEVALHRALERAAERAIVTQEALAGVGQPHAALRAAARRALHELEAGRVLQLTQVAPGVAVRHLERLGRLLERAALLDRLQQPRAAVAEFQVVTERHPDPELGLHSKWGPRHGPHTPLFARRAPAEPRRASLTVARDVAPIWPTCPPPPTPHIPLGPPRAPARRTAAVHRRRRGGRHPPPPHRSPRPGGAVTRLDHRRR